MLLEEGWRTENRARLELALERIQARGGRRVATLDWDNTMMRGDIGDLVLAHLIDRGAALGVPIDDPMLTGAARAALARARASDAMGEVVAHIAWRGTTPAGEAAFVAPVARFFRAAYAFIAQVLAHDRSDDALRALAREAWRDASAAELGAARVVAGAKVERFARLHAPMIELARALEGIGVEVWFVSASSQPIVEVMAEIAGFSPERVIGVRVAPDRDGVPRLEPCGEGECDTPVMTWGEGKRAWINREIFAVTPARQRMRQADPALRPVLAAGDSDGDVAMLDDATELRVVLDRGQPRITEAAAEGGVSWVVQPPFVAR